MYIRLNRLYQSFETVMVDKAQGVQSTNLAHHVKWRDCWYEDVSFFDENYLFQSDTKFPGIRRFSMSDLFDRIQGKPPYLFPVLVDVII